MAVKIKHWRFEDGKISPNADHPIPKVWIDPPPRGWYCWVYANDHQEFMDWMKTNCPSSDCTFRFNSGDPMITTFIKDDKDATLFQLKWQNN
jgi:hypothetical protein